MTENIDFLLVTEEERGERLDKVLASRFKEKYSRTYFQQLINADLVLVNGLPAQKRIQLEAEDEIEIQFTTLPTDISLTPEPIPLSILYEDSHLLVINKPAGMVVHPAPGNWNHTFVNALLHHCKTFPIEKSTRPGIVHRIDKDTSGVLLAAKTLEAQYKLIDLFSRRLVEKEYLAICIGKGVDGTIDAPIGRHPIHRKQMAVVSNGKQAITHCSLIGWNGKLSLVNIKIATGRTHQIRVHLKYKNTPVLGDPLYGNSSFNQSYSTQRQLLHARRVAIHHPITGEFLEFFAPIPCDMQKIIDTIL